MNNINNNLLSGLGEPLWDKMPVITGSAMIGIIGPSGKVSRWILLRNKMIYSHPLIKTINSITSQQNIST